MKHPIEKVEYTSHFLSLWKKLPKELHVEVLEREKIFRKDCFDSRLTTHKLHGRHKDLWSFSITHKHRILFRFVTENTVEFIAVGDHSVYQ